MEMVLNHTSDQHPWFQESRSSPAIRAATGTFGATRTRAIAERASFLSTPSFLIGPGTRFRRLTTGTAFSATNPT